MHIIEELISIPYPRGGWNYLHLYRQRKRFRSSATGTGTPTSPQVYLPTGALHATPHLCNGTGHFPVQKAGALYCEVSHIQNTTTSQHDFLTSILEKSFIIKENEVVERKRPAF